MNAERTFQTLDASVPRSLDPCPPSSGFASLAQQLQQDLDERSQQSLARSLRPLPTTGRIVEIAGQSLINLAGNDYLALSQHPRLKQAAIDAVRSLGVGSGASRLVVGHLDCHEQLEQRFATFKHAEAALLFPTGYMANLAVLTTLARRNDLILIDKLTHASLIDAARASEADVRTFRHLDYDHLAQRLKKNQAKRASDSRVFLVTDSVFSMDGDVADLRTVCELAEQYHAITVVDDAHATGLLGPNGEGLAAHQAAGPIDITISTASKGLGGLGGVVTSRRTVIDSLINHARSFMYTTASPPAQVAAIDAALDVVRDEPERRERVLTLAGRLHETLTPLGWTLPGGDPVTPIMPLIVGESSEALRLSEHLQSHGLLGVAIRPPTVAPGAARVRISLRCDLLDEDLDRLIQAVKTFNG